MPPPPPASDVGSTTIEPHLQIYNFRQPLYPPSPPNRCHLQSPIAADFDCLPPADPLSPSNLRHPLDLCIVLGFMFIWLFFLSTSGPDAYGAQKMFDEMPQ
ncbi:hypothetical protein L1887_23727 [Cichorium endivia]|nr:hypothetical protein L1887_23727 [Cichorium endivia]